MVPAGFMQLHGSFFDAYTFTLKIAKILSTLATIFRGITLRGSKGSKLSGYGGLSAALAAWASTQK
jgi:hypothetical protein